jgi:hypothetical protein
MVPMSSSGETAAMRRPSAMVRWVSEAGERMTRFRATWGSRLCDLRRHLHPAARGGGGWR